MANNNFQTKSPEQKAQADASLAKNQKYLRDLTERKLQGATYMDQNICQHTGPAKILFDLYKEKLCNGILKKHKQLASRSLEKTPHYINPLYAQLTNHTFGSENGVTLLKAVKLQVQARQGKFDKKLIRAWLDGTEAYLNSDEYKASRARKQA